MDPSAGLHAEPVEAEVAVGGELLVGVRRI
jgi:hypothetical protein